MAEVAVNGIELHYDRVGEGPPLLMLHGLGSSARDWENQVSHFGDTRELIVPDFRGHGRSDKPAGPYSIEEFASDIAGLVAKLIAVNALPAFEMTRISQRIQVGIRKIITRRLSMEKIGDVLSKRLFPDPDMDDQRAKMAERWAENVKAPYEASFQAILSWPGVKAEMSENEIPITDRFNAALEAALA